MTTGQGGMYSWNSSGETPQPRAMDGDAQAIHGFPAHGHGGLAGLGAGQPERCSSRDGPVEHVRAAGTGRVDLGSLGHRGQGDIGPDRRELARKKGLLAVRLQFRAERLRASDGERSSIQADGEAYWNQSHDPALRARERLLP